MRKATILILCAGFGNRMLDLTINTPKPLLKIKNTTLLGNAINFFTDIGVKEIFINTHYLQNKIEKYIIKNFKDYPLNLIYEPSILGTGGGVKNIFNYTTDNKICVINSDIFWLEENKKEIAKFINESQDVSHCKILLSKKENFYGLKKTNGDFNCRNGIISKWTYDNDIIFYSGIQVLSNNIFHKTKKIFSINDIWNNLILDNKLKGEFISSKILHIGDKNSFLEL
tara:strand:- start:503 stop:1183 length:681 start_codon:yes stop_codon:yes gene_type:complete